MTDHAPADVPDRPGAGIPPAPEHAPGVEPDALALAHTAQLHACLR